MLTKHWPWLVCVAGPLVTAAMGLIWVVVHPPEPPLSFSAATIFRPLLSISASSAEQEGDATLLDEPVNEVFSHRDADRSGALDLAEFLGSASGALQERRRLMFRELDRNEDGSVSVAEYRDYLSLLLDSRSATSLDH